MIGRPYMNQGIRKVDIAFWQHTSIDPTPEFVGRFPFLLQVDVRGLGKVMITSFLPGKAINHFFYNFVAFYTHTGATQGPGLA